MNIKNAHEFKETYPELANELDAKFPNAMPAIDKILNFLDNNPQAENFVKSFFVASSEHKKESTHKPTQPVVNKNISTEIADAVKRAINNISAGANGSRGSRRNIQAEEDVEASNLFDNVVSGINRRRRKQ